MLASKNKLSFIICDDDTDDQNMIQDAIRSIDINVAYTSVFHGNQLLDLLLKRGAYKGNKEAQTDAILLDINMPVMDGLSALREIKANPVLKEIPVFILYTTRKDDYISQCRALGVSGIYAKPGTAEDLKNILLEVYMICGGKRDAATSENR